VDRVVLDVVDLDRPERVETDHELDPGQFDPLGAALGDDLLGEVQPSSRCSRRGGTTREHRLVPLSIVERGRDVRRERDLPGGVELVKQPVVADAVGPNGPHQPPSPFERLAELVRRHQGKAPLRLVIDLADGARILLDADRDKVAWGPEFHRDLVALLGPGCARAAVSLGGRREDSARRGPPGRTPAGVG
jgi:hypothetical protein